LSIKPSSLNSGRISKGYPSSIYLVSSSSEVSSIYIIFFSACSIYFFIPETKRDYFISILIFLIDFIILIRSVSLSILSLALSYIIYNYFLLLKQQSQNLPHFKKLTMNRQYLSLLVIYIFLCLFNSFFNASGKFSLNYSLSESFPLS